MGSLLDLHELKKLNTYWKVTKNPHIIDEVLKELAYFPAQEHIIHHIERVEPPYSEQFFPISPKLSAIIIDFEGSPPFLIGLMVRDTLHRFYIKDHIYQEAFFLVVFDILRLIGKALLFAFSDFEKNAILLGFELLEAKGYNLDSFKFLRQIHLVNLQEGTHESLAAAIYKLGFTSTKDSLLRDHRLIYTFFELKKFEEILAHNKNCLLNTALLLQKRFLVKYRI